MMKIIFNREFLLLVEMCFAVVTLEQIKQMKIPEKLLVKVTVL